MAETNGVTLPQQAKSEGALNDTLTPDQKTPKGRTVKAEGPKLGDKGQFLPAEYALNTTDRDGKSHGLTRQDR